MTHEHETVCDETHDLSAFVVFTVLLQDETVHRHGCHGVQEGEDSDGDKELRGGGVVPDQEETLGLPSLTGGSIEVNLMKSEEQRERERENDTEKKCFSLRLLL